MNKNLLETVVDLDERGARDGDVHNARTAIAVVPEGFLDGLREPEFTSHEASTRPRAGAVLWALDEAGQVHVERQAPPAEAKPIARGADSAPAPPVEDDGPIVEIVRIETERPPFGSLPEIDLGDALVGLRASKSIHPNRPLPMWLVALLAGGAATAILLGWVAAVMFLTR